ncbi:MAG: MFS transporter [Myxococcales bacterium]|nr:MFS transporter [Myxococcales bacterium]
MRLSKSASFHLLASIILFFLAGSSAPTPLYAVYQAAWGFSPVTVTVVFGVYALAVLATLLVAGSLSDHVGRRPVLGVAALLQAVAMVLFATAQGVPALVLARVVQGLSTGAAAAAVGAGLLDVDRERGTLANAVGPMLGTATGGILSGLLVQYLPAPTELVYALLGAIFVAQAIGVLFMPETASRRPGALRSLRPRFRMPAQVRGQLVVAAPALVSSWALVGFYGSLGPSLVRRIAGSTAPALGGLSLFVLASVGAMAVLFTRRHAATWVVMAGTVALAAGVGLTLVALEPASLGLFFVGTAIAGAGFGMAFQGAIRSVLPFAAEGERAGVLSVLYVIAYLSMGLPAVFAGLRFVHGGGALTTAREYGAAVILLAALAHASAWLRRSSLKRSAGRPLQTAPLSQGRRAAFDR